jgi:hypothetical protein
MLPISNNLSGNRRCEMAAPQNVDETFCLRFALSTMDKALGAPKTKSSATFINFWYGPCYEQKAELSPALGFSLGRWSSLLVEKYVDKKYVFDVSLTISTNNQ